MSKEKLPLLREEHELRYVLEGYHPPRRWVQMLVSSELKKVQARRRKLTAEGWKTRILARATHINWRIYSEHEAS